MWKYAKEAQQRCEEELAETTAVYSLEQRLQRLQRLQHLQRQEQPGRDEERDEEPRSVFETSSREERFRMMDERLRVVEKQLPDERMRQDQARVVEESGAFVNLDGRAQVNREGNAHSFRQSRNLSAIAIDAPLSGSPEPTPATWKKSFFDNKRNSSQAGMTSVPDGQTMAEAHQMEGLARPPGQWLRSLKLTSPPMVSDVAARTKNMKPRSRSISPEEKSTNCESICRSESFQSSRSSRHDMPRIFGSDESSSDEMTRFSEPTSCGMSDGDAASVNDDDNLSAFEAPVSRYDMTVRNTFIHMVGVPVKKLKRSSSAPAACTGGKVKSFKAAKGLRLIYL